MFLRTRLRLRALVLLLGDREPADNYDDERPPHCGPPILRRTLHLLKQRKAAVFAGHAAFVDLDGVPIVAFDQLLSTTGHLNDPSAFGDGICAALSS